MTTPAKKPLPKLPKGVLKTDLIRPKQYARIAYDAPHVQLWYTERFGWCAPTLLIAKATYDNGRGTNRTYAVTMDGDLVRIGSGPHILHQVTVIPKKSRLKALQPLFDLVEKGRAKAGDTRDRISTRRMRGALRRDGYGLGW